MIESHKSTSDEERSSEIMNAGIEAKALMEHPMFARFFSEQAAEAVNAFANLPDNAGIDGYKAVHMRLKAINALKERLDRYIVDAQDEQIKLKKMGEITADNI